jgi:predicted RNA polymerase sigma factor
LTTACDSSSPVATPPFHPTRRSPSRCRELCGLTTEEIVRAFMVTPTTIAKRIVRAKAKIGDARIPYQVPELPDLPERLDMVLHVVYLVFNEGIPRRPARRSLAPTCPPRRSGSDV